MGATRNERSAPEEGRRDKPVGDDGAAASSSVGGDAKGLPFEDDPRRDELIASSGDDALPIGGSGVGFARLVAEPNTTDPCPGRGDSAGENTPSVVPEGGVAPAPDAPAENTSFRPLLSRASGDGPAAALLLVLRFILLDKERVASPGGSLVAPAGPDEDEKEDDNGGGAPLGGLRNVPALGDALTSDSVAAALGAADVLPPVMLDLRASVGGNPTSAGGFEEPFVRLARRGDAEMTEPLLLAACGAALVVAEPLPPALKLERRPRGDCGAALTDVDIASWIC